MKQEFTILDKDELKTVIQDLLKETITQIMSQSENSDQIVQPLITRDEAAKMLHVSLVTLNQWVKDGRIPAPKKIGKRVFFLRHLFIEFLLEQSNAKVNVNQQAKK
jgi:excisionase family DNA binding protein